MTMESIEYEYGVPIPGRILPEAEWAKTAIKRLPVAGPLDWASIFGRTAPVVLDLGCGNGRFTLMSAVNRPGFDHFAIHGREHAHIGVPLSHMKGRAVHVNGCAGLRQGDGVGRAHQART